MAKEYKKFDITKRYTTKEVIDQNTGEVKDVPVSYKFGEITVFSDKPIPEDLSIKIEVPEQFLMGTNQLNVFPWKKRES